MLTGVGYSTLKKGVSGKRINLSSSSPSHSDAETASSRSQEDARQLMGKACCNVVERASKGSLTCPVEFQNQTDLQYAGVLVTLPALLAGGLLRGIERFNLPNVYYTTTQIFLSLALMVMLRVKQLEQSQLLSCGELGRCLGMDRTPDVQTLRKRLVDFTAAADVAEWTLERSREWLKQDAVEGVLYVDGHVKIYYGKAVDMPERYVSRMRLCCSGCTDYWVNDAIGQPYFVVHKTINEGMIRTILDDIIPELDKSLPNQSSAEELEKKPLLHRYMLVFDREAYSVPFFIELKKQRIAFCTYRKNVKDKWDTKEFQDYTVVDKFGQKVHMKLAERRTFLLTKKEKGKPQESIEVREIRKLGSSGHQTSIISNNFELSSTDIGIYMFARWCQENFFKYAIESFGIDCLVSNFKSSIPDTYKIPNPAYKSLCREQKSIAGKLAKQKQKLAEKQMEMDRSETPEKTMNKYLRQKSEILETVELYQADLDVIRQKKSDTPKHVDINEVKPQEELLTVVNDRKQLIDTIKMVGYWAETSLANEIKPLMSNPDEARNVIRSIYQSNADLVFSVGKKCYQLTNKNDTTLSESIQEGSSKWV